MGRKRKRMPPKNRHTKKVFEMETSNVNLQLECSSSKKLQTNDKCDHDELVDNTDYFILFNFSILKNFITPMLFCPECHSHQQLVISDKLDRRMGLAHQLEFVCMVCEWKGSLTSSKECSREKKPQGRRTYEANVRAIIACREIGRGHHAMQTFTQCMNMYSIGNASFENLNNGEIFNAYDKVAKASMKRAANELQDKNIDGPARKRVKIDGAWQKRGHASLNGVVTAIVEDKVVDKQAFSKHCKGCKMWNNKMGSPAYERWQADHICHVNHTKSSGAMEAAGAIQMFNRSVEKNNLIYSEYLGDGDTSSFKEVVTHDPYKQYHVQPVKLECVGHVQKRLGTRLRNVVKAHKGTKKPISGRGKLTENVINSMQNYYGMAIRNNCSNLYAMKKAVGAILWHCTAFSDQDKRHAMCPTDANTWCKWQLDKLNGTNTYRDKISIPKAIYTIIKPVFNDLSANDLLKKCLHGQTQNTNEAFNSIIWTRCPKNIFISRSTFEIGINSAVIHYNDGGNGIKAVFSHFGLSGKVTFEQFVNRDCKRVRQMMRKSSERVKKQRKRLRTIKKGYLDKEKESEKVDSYVAGGF